MDAYYQSLKSVQLYGPTNFSPVINHVARYKANIAICSFWVFLSPPTACFLSHHLFHLRHILLSLLIQLLWNVWLNMKYCIHFSLIDAQHVFPAAAVASQHSRDGNKQQQWKKDCMICISSEPWALFLLWNITELIGELQCRLTPVFFSFFF